MIAVSNKQPKVRRKFLSSVLVIALALAVLILTHRLAIYDWLRLRGYHPSAAIAQLATDDTMTPYARHIYYVNHPALEDKASFAPNCPNGTEQTVVLGCYQSNQDGIYLLQVTNPDLAGIEQVTAAHETLHAAYDRLSSAERTKVDAMLENYYQHGLTDPNIKATMADYKQSEPGEVVNEMHSVFGTEVADLPAPLESYYSRYFTDRAKITSYYATYEAAFTSRQDTLKQDDAQLTTWKTQINSLQASVNAKQASLSAERTTLDNDKSNGNISAYNSGVSAYNQAVSDYNAEVASLQNLTAQYNQLVVARNSVALEEQQLVKAITSSAPSEE